MADEREERLQGLYYGLDLALDMGNRELVERLLQHIDNMSQEVPPENVLTASFNHLTMRSIGPAANDISQEVPRENASPTGFNPRNVRSMGSLDLLSSLIGETILTTLQVSDSSDSSSSRESNDSDSSNDYTIVYDVTINGHNTRGSELGEVIQQLLANIRESGLAPMEDVAVPLPAELLQKIPVYPSGSTDWRQAYNTQCHICLSEMASAEADDSPERPNAEMIRLLPCRHAYHRECIDTWLKEHIRCPDCKVDLRDLLGPVESQCAPREEKKSPT